MCFSWAPALFLSMELCNCRRWAVPFHSVVELICCSLQRLPLSTRQPCLSLALLCWHMDKCMKLAHAWCSDHVGSIQCACGNDRQYYKRYSTSAEDIRTTKIYILTNGLLVYVGLVQARPNYTHEYLLLEMPVWGEPERERSEYEKLEQYV